MFNVIMEHVIVNVMLFIFCLAFILDNNTIIDDNNKPNIKDVWKHNGVMKGEKNELCRCSKNKRKLH